MANRMCTWFDKLFKWIGIGAVGIGAFVAFLHFASKYYNVLEVPLANQLGI
jgi:hypothetical protein